MLRSLCLGFAGAGVIASAAADVSAPPISHPEAIITAFTPELISSFLNELELRGEGHRAEGGVAYYVVTLPSGADFVMTMRACDERQTDSCLGLEMFAYFAVGAGADLSEAANVFNGGYPFAKVFLTDNGTPVLARYLIADGGISRANMFYNLTNFLGAADRFAAFIDASGPVSMLAPGARAPRLPVAALHAAPAELDAIEKDLPPEALNRGLAPQAFALPQAD